MDVKTARQFGGGIAAGGSELDLRQTLGGGEVGAADVRGAELGARQVRIPQNRAVEIDMAEIGVPERSAGEIAAAAIGVARFDPRHGSERGHNGTGGLGLSDDLGHGGRCERAEGEKAGQGEKGEEAAHPKAPNRKKTLAPTGARAMPAELDRFGLGRNTKLSCPPPGPRKARPEDKLRRASRSAYEETGFPLSRE